MRVPLYQWKRSWSRCCSSVPQTCAPCYFLPSGFAFTPPSVKPFSISSRGGLVCDVQVRVFDP